MPKKIMLFAPVTFDLAERLRMLEIAKGIRDHPQASKAFDIQFISNGGDLNTSSRKRAFH